MKKIIMIFTVLHLISTSFVLGMCYDENPLGIDSEKLTEYRDSVIKKNISNLVRYNLVINPYEKWKDGDLITRRQAVEILVATRQHGNRTIRKNWVDYPWLFTDLPRNSYDYSLANEANQCYVFNGRINENGEVIADFDSLVTYKEALIFIARLFPGEMDYFYQTGYARVNEYDKEFPFFELFEQWGLINSNNVFDYSTLTVTYDMADKYISAYDFMMLLNDALYVSYADADCYGYHAYEFRYIDLLVDSKKIYSEQEWHDDKNNYSIR